MDEVELHSTHILEESVYIRPMRVIYSQKDGVKKKWDYIRVHDSVAILIYNVSLNCIVMVKQFRPAVYMHDCHRKFDDLEKNTEKTLFDIAKEYPASNGVMYELCAGIADKDGKSPAELAAMEVLEETGYDVPVEKLILITKYRSGIGTHGNVQSLFYAEVTEEMEVHKGGGLESEGEMIETYHLPVAKIQEFIDDHSSLNRPSGCLFALMWFLANKRQYLQSS
uniref:uridine diphosphate glucose pyrophosphatase NUDT14-like n=1 Tax=Styela clava TaxID=7725 RepID=UPI00193A43C6|nr:uridine diphosphate glucose pyrophosphatase NUDT14-like [Styela clava]